jgi:hypothetical protein
MANTKISALGELAETPATNDLYLVVDVSDTTMSATGTNKYIQASRIVHNDSSGNSVIDGAFTAGTIGIGVLTPAAKLHMSGNGQLVSLRTTTSTTDNYISFHHASTLRCQVGLETTNKALFLSSWYGDLIFRAANVVDTNSPTEFLRIKSGGNVGIGTASPNSKLDVVGTVQMDGLRLDQTPASGTFTNTHYINVNLNGTTYRIACAV